MQSAAHHISSTLFTFLYILNYFSHLQPPSIAHHSHSQSHAACHSPPRGSEKLSVGSLVAASFSLFLHLSSHISSCAWLWWLSNLINFYPEDSLVLGCAILQCDSFIFLLQDSFWSGFKWKECSSFFKGNGKISWADHDKFCKLSMTNLRPDQKWNPPFLRKECCTPL